MSKYALEIKNVSKSFRLPTEQSNGIKQAFVNWTKGIKGYKEQKVLQDISFNVEKGDFFGIVGRNGSGKSTLLKLISQIYEPDKGEIVVNGKLVPFIELGVGFNPELTGRENIYLNGALLGFSHDEVSGMYQEIVDFAELHDFMDQKLKNYSSGMQVRLAFSIAIKAQGDVLVLDEVLAVGDEAFQRKCDQFFDDIKKDKEKTVVLVTHSMESVKKYCDKAMMIKNGEVVAIGDPEDVANEYSVENLDNKSGESQEANNEEDAAIRIEPMLISPVKINQDQDIELVMKYSIGAEVNSYIIVGLQDIDRNVPIMSGRSKISPGGERSYRVKFNVSALNDSNIKVVATIRNRNMDILGYLHDVDAPRIALRRTDYKEKTKKPTHSVLFERGVVDSEQ